MNKVVMAFGERERGQFPLSIGTSLAFEAAAGVYPERPEKPAPFSSVKEIHINLRTIYRNLIGSVPTEIRDAMLPKDVQMALCEELQIIDSVVDDVTNRSVKPIVYFSEYADLKKKFPNATLREPKTPKQIQAHGLEEASLQLYFEQNPDSSVVRIKHDIQTEHPSSLIITHLPVDLLAVYKFKQLRLLESHSGKIKPRTAWNSKLTGGKNLENMPFNKFTLQLFGDNNNHFVAKLPTLKREVEAIALKDNWSPLTTAAKIESSLKRIEDPEIRKSLLDLL